LTCEIKAVRRRIQVWRTLNRMFWPYSKKKTEENKNDER
jgi:hypothetical protein